MNEKDISPSPDIPADFPSTGTLSAISGVRLPRSRALG